MSAKIVCNVGSSKSLLWVEELCKAPAYVRAWRGITLPKRLFDENRKGVFPL